MLGIHEPASGVALVFDLVVCAQVPLAGALHAPERVVWARAGRFDGFGIIGSALHCNTAILVLDFIARNGNSRRGMDVRTQSSCTGRGGCHWSDWNGDRGICDSRVRGGGRRDDSGLHTGVRVGICAAGHDGVHTVVGPLIRVIVVSIHTTPVSEGRCIRGNVGVRIRISRVGRDAVAQTRVAAHETSVVAVGAAGDVRAIVER